MTDSLLDAFATHKFTGANGVELPYRLYHTENNELKPLVLFLHGSGQRGTDNEIQVLHTSCVTKIHQYVTEVEDAIILAPQAPMAEILGAWIFDDIAATLVELVQDVVKNYPIDQSRMYVCGLSNGGAGTLQLLINMPKTFAAAVPICGYIGGDANDVRVMPRDITPEEATKIGLTPIWLFHAIDDDVVPVDGSRMVAKLLRELGNKNVHYTEYLPGEVDEHPHCCWENAFANEELLPWLFSQKLD